MDVPAQALRDALVAAYRPYLSKIIADHGIGDAVDHGERWLTAKLEELLSVPFVSQRRGPLEVFQEALRFPTAALGAAGLPAAARSAPDERSLPGDTYGLAPASTQDLGEEVWQAHIAWGATKAAALTTVCWFGRDLADRSKVEDAVSKAGRRFVVAPADLGGCGRVVVDLSYGGADKIIEEATTGDWPTVVYGPHVDRSPLEEAAARGALAVPRSKFFADPGSFVAK